MVSFKIATRYVFSKKSTNAIQLISWLSIGGLSIGTAALVLILSVFNGFEDLLSNVVGALNPDIKITSTKGKFFLYNDTLRLNLNNTEGVALYSSVIEESALSEFEGTQAFAKILAVDSMYFKVTNVSKAIVDGRSDLYGGNVPGVIVGMGLANKLGVRINDDFTYLKIFAPRVDFQPGMEQPFNQISTTATGVFSVQQEPDNELIICDLKIGQQLLGVENLISAINIKCSDPNSIPDVLRQLKGTLGSNYTIKDRIAQDESFMKLINMEKWVSYAVVCFALILIAFNLVGCLWIIVLDKQKDIAVLKSMGMLRSAIGWIFGWVGLLYSMIGFSMGLTIATVVYFLHKRYKLIKIPDSFVVDSYPASMRVEDIFTVLFTVVLIGVFCSLPAIYRAMHMDRSLRMG